MDVIYYLMKGLYGLRDSGNIDYHNAVGQIGTVYVPIPPAQSAAGQIEVMIQGRIRFVDAFTNHPEKIKSTLAGSLPPLHDLTRNVGIQLPEFLGKLVDNPHAPSPAPTIVEKAAALPPELEIRNKIQEWLKLNFETVTNYELNQEIRLDPSRVDELTHLILFWAAKTRDAGSRWFHALGAVTGPLAWTEIVKALKGQGKTFIRLEESEVWLPYELILSTVKHQERKGK